jgi:hypothetical protein
MIITGAWDFVLDWLDNNFVDNDTIMTVIILAAIGGVMYWVTKGDSKKE